MYKIRVLESNEFEDVIDLYVESFMDDHYFNDLFADKDVKGDKGEMMRVAFSKAVQYCIDTGLSIGIIDAESNRFLGIALFFDYLKVKERQELMWEIFGYDVGNTSIPLCRMLNFTEKKARHMNLSIYYLLAIAVRPKHRRQGLGSAMIDHAISEFSPNSIVSDVSNPGSLAIYSARGFEIDEIGDDYYFVVKLPT